MSIWTREELLGLITDWKAAYKAASTGQSYTIGGRSLTRQNLSEIRSQLDFLQGELEALTDRNAGSLKFVRCRTVR